MGKMFNFKLSFEIKFSSIIIMGITQIIFSYYLLLKVFNVLTAKEVAFNPWIVVVINALGVFMLLGRKIITILAQNTETNINVGK